MTDAIQEIIDGDAPVFLLIAGPNGASKSTFTGKRLSPIGFPVIDPDAVGWELYGRFSKDSHEALAASLEAERRVRKALQERRSIALESVFSDTQGYKLALLREAREAGFRPVLVFIGVDSPEICIARVMDRVAHGGHDVPDQTIRRRFPRCFDNLKKSLRLVDLVLLLDNSGCYGSGGAQPDGQRHYQFGVIQCGKSVQLQASLPAWYKEFSVAAAVQTQCT